MPQHYGDIFSKLAMQNNFGAGLQQPQQAPQKSGILNSVGNLLNNPFLMNLLAQQGFSTMPQSRLGAVGRAGVATAQQERQTGLDEIQKRLFESQIGLNQARTLAPGDEGKPLTDIAKLRADLNAGRVSPEVFSAQRDKVLREGTDNIFDQTQKLRGEFRNDTDSIRTSQTALANAKSLVGQGNPIAATAAFTSFIRSIDNSVVRPAEQAAYSAAGGLARRLEDELSKLSGKGPLGENTRRDLLKSIETLETQMNSILGRTVDFYNNEATISKLRPESVTGIPSIESPDVVISRSDEEPDEISAIDAEIAEIDRQLADGNN